ncbi:hypothetical protein A2773_05750 [Candidatus Gottesmanbacteria bacterium RIFCSPHIGHO2_01_FULL_39_10]|uniref:Uncharacterized protein n=1 Tax=Candidatus Gottesmanbacteria bacterium RIFCSPHIGHO2_01_FULL_39_10 TaxID=1798375 RepID=A0A1F5ZNW8_9BACT|nr:MAG: hypothetical protein A2773_05750 [Candidatus Gottesmanbacteria bacterium RIFCSPHIGHO2_01_FULL_39_10]
MKNIYRKIVFYSGNREALKVSGDFVIYWDNTLKRHPVMCTDVPHYFEMVYEDESPAEMEAVSGYGYDPKTRKYLKEPSTIKVPRESLINQQNDQRLRELLVLIYVLTDKYFFEYDHKQGWFIEITAKEKPQLMKRLRYGQQFYFSNKKSPKKLKKFPNEKYVLTLDPAIFIIQNASGEINRDINLSDIVSGFYILNKRTQAQLMNAFYSIYDARTINNTSLSFISLINSIETLIHHKYKDKGVICKGCDRPKYAVVQKFHDFIRENYDGYQGTGKKGEGRDKFVNEIYTLRSKIVHNGKLISRNRPFYSTVEDTRNELISREIYDRAEGISKAVAKRYLLKQIFKIENE